MAPTLLLTAPAAELLFEVLLVAEELLVDEELFVDEESLAPVVLLAAFCTPETTLETMLPAVLVTLDVVVWLTFELVLEAPELVLDTLVPELVLDALVPELVTLEGVSPVAPLAPAPLIRWPILVIVLATFDSRLETVVPVPPATLEPRLLVPPPLVVPPLVVPEPELPEPLEPDELPEPEVEPEPEPEPEPELPEPELPEPLVPELPVFEGAVTTTGATGVTTGATTGATVPVEPDPPLGTVVPLPLAALWQAALQVVCGVPELVFPGRPVLESVSVRRPTLMREPVRPLTGSASTVDPPDTRRV